MTKNILNVRLLTILFMLGIILVLVSCQPLPGRKTKSKDNVILFGIDGGEWHIMHPLLKMGRLPVMERLIGSGSYGRLFSPTQQSPSEWTSIATGKHSHKHGILGFGRVEAKGIMSDRSKRPRFTFIARKSRKSKTFWNILSEHNRTVGIIGWWATWPAESVNGTLVCDTFNYRSYLEYTVYPPQFLATAQGLEQSAHHHARVWLSRNLAEFRQRTPAQMKSDLRYLTGQVDKFSDHLSYDYAKKEMAHHLISQNAPDLLALYLRSSDLSSHFFFKDSFIKDEQKNWSVTLSDRLHFGGIVVGIYQLYDRFLSDIISLYPEQPALIVVSDHGFGSTVCFKRFEAKKFLSKSGLMIDDETVSELFRVKRIDKVVWQLFPKSSKTHSTAQAKQVLLQKLEQAFRQLVTPDGRPLFTRLSLIGAANSTPETENYLEIEPNPDILLTDVINTPSQQIPAYKFFRYNRWSGSHRPYGIVIFNGSPFKKQHLIQSDITTWDICPTILSMFQLPRAQDMDGEIIEEIFQDTYRADHPLQPEVKTYEAASQTEDIPDIDPKVKEKILQELKTIGYIS
ncbi:alkaline phosphatase family protein [candidate division CSSED10-310 bacterium]|uniref:Alkaline phosphatase family protein n=1 Tax=candidate division CSSED10-310 bacterium TaxID=2855610 RepID=A0ABV6YRZ3_UNCC1